MLRYFVFCLLLTTGCSVATQAFKVAKHGHNYVQEMIEETRAFCRHGRSLLIERNLDTSVLESYCTNQEAKFRGYEKITDLILDE